MDSFRWTSSASRAVDRHRDRGGARLHHHAGREPPQPASAPTATAARCRRRALLRVPVTGIYPGGTPTGLNANMQNPLANDPDAVQRGMKDFDAFNCSGCHMANARRRHGAVAEQRYLDLSFVAREHLSRLSCRAARRACRPSARCCRTARCGSWWPISRASARSQGRISAPRHRSTFRRPSRCRPDRCRLRRHGKTPSRCRPMARSRAPAPRLDVIRGVLRCV